MVSNQVEQYLVSVLDKDNFLLCLQTEFQCDVMKIFADKVICIDATHSVLVLDEFGEGVPVAWAISDKEITDIIF